MSKIELRARDDERGMEAVERLLVAQHAQGAFPAGQLVVSAPGSVCAIALLDGALTSTSPRAC